MYPMQQQLADAARAQFDAQAHLYRELNQTMLESVEKLTRLNLAAARASMEESSASARQLLSAQDAQQAMSLLRAQTGPTFGKFIAYSNHLINIATNAQADLTRAAEQQLAASGRRAMELVDEAARHAPPGAEHIIGLFKAVVGNAGAGYEQLNRSSRRVLQLLESNMSTAVGQAVPPAASAGPAA